MGIDFGARRTGVAISDESGLFAHPLITIDSDQIDEVIETIARYATQHQIEAIVVGLPISLSGSDTEQTGTARQFALRLEEKTGIQVKLQDERLSSAGAKSAIGLVRREEAGRGRIHGSSRKKKSTAGHDKSKIDRIAAVLILQSYLDKTRNDLGR